MKMLISILITIITLSSCSNSRVVITDIEIPEDVFYLKDEIKPYTGLCITNYVKSNAVKEEMSFIDGILHGTMVSYYPDGSVKRRGQYVNGRMEGKWEAFYPNGKQCYIVHYVNDTLNGDYLAWFDTGVMREKGKYTDNIRLGEWAEYDEAGMLINTEDIN